MTVRLSKLFHGNLPRVAPARRARARLNTPRILNLVSRQYTHGDTVTRHTHGTTYIVIDTVLPAQYRRAARSAGAARERVSVCARVARRPADRRPGATAAVGGRCARRAAEAEPFISDTPYFFNKAATVVSPLRFPLSLGSLNSRAGRVGVPRLRAA